MRSKCASPASTGCGGPLRTSPPAAPATVRSTTARFSRCSRARPSRAECPMRGLAAALVFALHAAVASADPAAEALAATIERGDTPALREALATYGRAKSLDDAATLFAAAIEQLPRNRAFRARFDAARRDPFTPPAGREHYLFVFVPGWLYRTNPESGADFARPRRVLAAHGYAVQFAEIDENGTVEAN